MSNGMSNGPGALPACSEAGPAPQDAPTSVASSEAGAEPCQTGPKGSGKVSAKIFIIYNVLC